MNKLNCITHYSRAGTWTFHREKGSRTYKIGWLMPSILDLLTDILAKKSADCTVYFENGKLDCIEWYLN